MSTRGCGDWDAQITQILRRKKLKAALYRVGTILLYLCAAFVSAMSVYAVGEVFGFKGVLAVFAVLAIIFIDNDVTPCY